MGSVGIFFWVNGKFFFHGCKVDKAEHYGDFFIYDKSHFEIWSEFYFNSYQVDYDYFPRGRVVFDKATGKYWVYKDPCINEEDIKKMLQAYGIIKYVCLEDEHYRCHCCDSEYIDIASLR